MPPDPPLPPSYKSLTYTHPSTPPHISHRPLNPPDPNSLLVRLHASSINPVDLQLWGSPLVGYLAGTKDKGIGRDYSGTVVRVGSKIASDSKWEVGDEVFGFFCNPVSDIFSGGVG